MSAIVSLPWVRFTLLILALAAHAFGQLGGSNSININVPVNSSFMNGIANQGCWITGSNNTAMWSFSITNPPPFSFQTLPNGGGSCWALFVSGTASVSHQGTTTVIITEAGNTGFATLSINWNVISPLTFPPQTLAQATVDRSFSATVSATGGTGTISHQVTGGALPAGLSLAANGAITGTPTASGTFNFTVTATDSSNTTAQQSFALTVNPAVALYNLASQFRTMGQSFSLQPSSVGGTAPLTWSASFLPPGTSINTSTGAITGTISSWGTGTATVTVTEANGGQASTNFFYSLAQPIGGLGGPLPNGSVGTAYSFQLSGTGGLPPLTWSMFSGSLPAGLTLSPGGLISGTPTSPGTPVFSIQATDANGATATGLYQVTIVATVQITTSSLPPATVGGPVNTTLSAVNGATNNYTFSVTGGALPSGLSLQTNGNITGTPTTAGTASFTVQATEASSSPGSANLQWVVNPAPSFPSLSFGTQTVGAYLMRSVAATGGTAPLAYSVHAGNLPPGISLSGSTLSGTFTSAGTFAFTLRVTDANGVTADLPVSQSVNAVPVLGSWPLSPGRVGQSVMGTIPASGGTAPLTVGISSGSLPSGLILAPNGGISGVLTAAGTFHFTVQVTDANGVTATQAVSFLVRPVVSLQPSGTLPPATAQAPYSLTLGATNLQEPVSYSLGVSVLPPGMTFSGSTISGIPTMPGSYSFGVIAQGADGDMATATLDLLVNPPLEFILPPTPQMVVGQPVTWRPTLKGGTPPWLVSILGNSLPAGFQLDSSTGVITGTPTQPGNFQFTIEATDANAARVQHFVRTTVREAIVVDLRLASVYPQGKALEANAIASEGVAPYTFRLAAGRLPAGVSLTGSRLSGTPEEPGSFSFTLEVTDAAGSRALSQHRLLVADGFLLSTNALSFRVQPGLRSARQTVKFDSMPGGIPLEWAAGPAWLKTELNRSLTPGAVDVWVDATGLESGRQQAEMEFVAPGLSSQKLTVELLVFRAEDAALTVNHAATGPQTHLVSLRAQLPEVPFTARLEGPGAVSYQLSATSGQATADGATGLLVSPAEDRSRLGLEATVVITNALTGDVTRVALPVSDVPPVVLSATSLRLLQPASDTAPRNVEVLLRSQTGARRYATIVDAPWLQLSPDTGELNPLARLNLRIIPAALLSGENHATVTVYLEDGRPAATLHLVVEGQAPRNEPSVETTSLVFSPTRTAGQLRLRNPGRDTVDFHIRASVAALDVPEFQGTLAPGESRTVAVAASAFAGRASYFVSFGNGSPVVVDAFWLAPQASCSAQPTIAWLSPSRGSALKAGLSAPVEALLTNGCGQPITTGALSLLLPSGNMVSLVSHGDGLWSTHWPASQSADLELLFVSADGRQQTRQKLPVTVADQP